MLKKLIIFTSTVCALTACGHSSAEPTPVAAVAADASIPSPAPSQACINEMQSRFNAFQTQQLAWYKQHGSMIPTPDNQSQLRIGTNGRVIVLLHGFLSSPAYMKDMADEFAKQGYTLVIPLMTGYASDSNAANVSTVDDWKASINTAFTIARVCSTSVSLFAHSLGAALATEELEDGTLGNLDRIILMAPYYRTYTEWMKTVMDHFPLSIQSVDVNKVQAWLSPIGIQIPSFQLTPGTDFTLPLISVRTVLDLQDQLGSFAGRLSNIDILPVVSMEDETIDSTYALSYIEQHFHEVDPIAYPVGDHVYHSLETRADNPKFAQLITQLTAYLNESHH